MFLFKSIRLRFNNNIAIMIRRMTMIPRAMRISLFKGIIAFGIYSQKISLVAMGMIKHKLSTTVFPILWGRLIAWPVVRNA
jgi:hypothetical protein